jgi:hypothetical protein
MTIDIAYYISKIECLMGIVLDRAKESGINNAILPDDQKNILLAGVLTAAKKLEEEIYNEVKEKEGRSYDFPSNEMQLLAFAIIWSAYSGWVFKAKSDDPQRQDESRKQAEAVSKHVEAMIVNAIRGGQNIGNAGGRPEGKEPITIA